MTQKHVSDKQYRIQDPKYIDPSYNIDHFNKILRDRKVLSYVPTDLLEYLQQYSNNINIDGNYNYDMTVSQGLLKYLNSYNSNPIPNYAYNKRQIDVNNYYIMKYQSETYLLKLIIFFCGLALIGSLFFLKGLIGESLYILYLGIIISVGIIMIVYNIYKLIYRDNMKFDEIDFGYMSTPGTDISYADLMPDIDPKLENPTCVG
jgi:hypothetical protein